VLILLVRNIEIEKLGKFVLIFVIVSFLIVMKDLILNSLIEKPEPERKGKYLPMGSSLKMVSGIVVLSILLLMREFRIAGFYFPLFALVGIFSIPAVTSTEKVPTFSYLKSMNTMFMFIFPLTAFLAFRAEDIIPHIFGQEFEIAVSPFQIIIWSLPPVTLNYFLYRFIPLTNRLKITLLILISAVLFSILLNLYLIPRYGLAGACTATLVAEVLLLVVSIFYIRRFDIKIPFYKSAEKPLVATLGLMVVLHYFASTQLFIALLMGIGSYCLVLLVISMLEEEGYGKKVNSNQ